jgi:hypothetical protein
MNATKRPNVLFVLGEDWGRYASAYAPHDAANSPSAGLNAFVNTPNFDSVAAEGVLFLNARTPAPGWCVAQISFGKWLLVSALEGRVPLCSQFSVVVTCCGVLCGRDIPFQLLPIL